MHVDIDLTKLTLFEVFRLALRLSGKSESDIAEAMGWPPANAHRIFADDSYWPTLPNIPRLCAALGNQVILDWCRVQAAAMPCPERAKPLNPPALLDALAALFEESGQLAGRIRESAADGTITSIERRRITREAYDVAVQALSIIAGLSAASGREEN